MAKFFELYKNEKIGYKTLSDADLGTSSKSNQTHIGLFDDVLTFLPDTVEIDDALFIYENTTHILQMNYDRIKNPDGTYRSPKIRIGERGSVSVATLIRDIASKQPDLTWYLVWFGLKSKQPVFFMFNSQSSSFTDITDMTISLKKSGRIEESDAAFRPFMRYLENIVNTSGQEMIRELEIVSQTGFIPPGKRFRKFDIKRMTELFEKTGREGEEFVRDLLTRKKENNEILSFKWYNEQSESGRPYDFHIEELSCDVIYLDVKSTTLSFDQQIIFSSQELSFINSHEYDYHVYRVYNLGQAEKCLRICKDFKTYSALLNKKINSFIGDIITIDAKLQTAKFSIPTSNENFTFENEIKL